LQLIEDFPYLPYGIPPQFFGLFSSIGIIFLLFAIFNAIKPQLPKDNPTIRQFQREVDYVFVFLLLGAVALILSPALAILVYLAFVFYLSIESYELQKSDPTGEMFLVSLGASAAFLVPMFALIHWTPFITAQVAYYYVMMGWSIVAAFGSGFGALYFKIKPTFYLSAPFQSWAINTTLQFAYLYGSGDMELSYRIVWINQQFPIVFVIVPLLTLLFNEIFMVMPHLLGLVDQDVLSGIKKRIQKDQSKTQSAKPKK